MKLARTKNAVRNIAWGVIYRMVTLIGPFAIKTIIIRMLGLEYSGLNSLFTSILTVLNLANLGFSSSLVYTMYQAAVDEDNDRLCAMLRYFRNAYRVVGIVILGMGIALMPFLPHLVKSDVPPDVNLYILFSIYLVETAMSYLMFGYNSAIFETYQRNDLTLRISTVRYLLQYGLQCAVLVVMRNYYAYILILPLAVLLNNLMTHFTARKYYPDLTCRGKLDKPTKQGIYQRVATLFGHKVGSTVLVSVDSVIISSFLGLRELSIYSNYHYILTAVNGLVEIFTNASIAGIGNKLITDTPEENYSLFRTMTYGWLTLIGGAATCMMCFYQPFVSGVWLGEEYLMDNRLMALIVLYFYAWMFRIMQLTYRDAAGLWTRDWLKPYVAIVLNLAGSIAMVLWTESVAGVLIPTIIVMLFVYFPWEAWVLFRHLFRRSWKEYLVQVTGLSALSAVCCGVCYGLCMLISPGNSLISLVIRVAIVGVTFPGIWLLATGRCAEFKRMLGIAKRFLKR